MEEDWTRNFHDLIANIHLLHKTQKIKFKLFNIRLVKGFVKWRFCQDQTSSMLKLTNLWCIVKAFLTTVTWSSHHDFLKTVNSFNSSSLVLNPVSFDMGFLFHSFFTSVITFHSTIDCTGWLKYLEYQKRWKRKMCVFF